MKKEEANKDFVLPKEAIALKELGYNEQNFGFYHGKDYTKLRKTLKIKNNNASAKLSATMHTVFVSAPLYQQAFRWFREEHKLFGFPEIGAHEISYKIFDLKIDKTITNRKNEFNGNAEEAELECLKALIEIVKKRKNG